MEQSGQPERRRVIRTAVVLFLVAVAVYGSFIFAQYLRSQGGS
ncbi:MAG: hypothetical protein PVG91_02860 [Gammaproteobacteria bacterium]|jgi:hypothetical protein